MHRVRRTTMSVYVRTHCPCVTRPYVTLERRDPSHGTDEIDDYEEERRIFVRGRNSGSRLREIRERYQARREESHSPRCRQAEHVYRRRGSRGNVLEVDSPVDVAAIGEIGVEILDALVGLQVTDGHSWNVSWTCKYLTENRMCSAGDPFV